MNDLKTRVEELLRSLGDDPDAVYGALMGRGIEGNRSDGCSCPIANLIRAEFAEAGDDAEWLHPNDLGTVPGWFVLRDQVYTPDGLVETPWPVAQFISRFDDGEHPEGDKVLYPYNDLNTLRGAAEAARAEP